MKYKILKQGKGFAVWVLHDYGQGSAYDLDRKFPTQAEAENYVAEAKKKNEKLR